MAGRAVKHHTSPNSTEPTLTNLGHCRPLPVAPDATDSSASVCPRPDQWKGKRPRPLSFSPLHTGPIQRSWSQSHVDKPSVLIRRTRPSDHSSFLFPPPTLPCRVGAWRKLVTSSSSWHVWCSRGGTSRALGSEADPVFALMSERSLRREHPPPAWL